jgi:hypothetical protein
LSTAGGESGSAQTTEYQKVNDYLVKNAWYAPLFSLGATFVVGKGVANVTPPTTANTTIDPVAPEASLSWYPSK